MKPRNTFLSAVLLSLLISCASQPTAPKAPRDFPELNIALDGSEPRYMITTYQYRGNALGETQDVSGYRAVFVRKALADNCTFLYLYQIEIADAAKEPSVLVWKTLPQLSELRLIVDSTGDLNSAAKYLQQIPHDSMETYNIYVSLMDITSYWKYLKLAEKELSDSRTVYEIPGGNYRSSDWAPIVRDITFEQAPTYLSAVGTSASGEKVYYYKNDNTEVHQTISTGPFRMPSRGTTRYFGFIWVDKTGDLSHATLSEYFAMEIRPVFFMKMNMLVRREQILQRL